MKGRDSSGSSDSNDIDLEEILKTIEPLDVLEKRILSVDYNPNAPRTTSIAPPKKEPVRDVRSDGKTNGDPVVLTSLPSDNVHGKSESLGQSLSKNLERDNVAGSGGTFNASARARRRNSKFGSEVESASSSAVGGEKLAHSSLETGLWSGDALWNLNVGGVSDTPGISKASLTTASKSFDGGSMMKSVPSQPLSSEKKGDRKPGKYDWLGLLDDESGEEGESMGSKDKKVSTILKSSVPQEINSRDRRENQNVSSSGVNNGPSKVGKGSLSLSVGENIGVNISQTVEPKGKSNQSSLSENSGSQKGGSKSSESNGRKPVKKTLGEGKAALIVDIFKDDNMNALGQSKVGVGRDKYPGASGEGIVDKGEQLKASVFPRRISLLEEEEKSTRSYTPTLLGGSPEGSIIRAGRRAGQLRRPIINDPLDLFDDGPSKLETSLQNRTDLPDWLKSPSSKMSKEKEKDSQIIHDGSSAEVKKDIDRKEVLKTEEKRSDLGSQKGLKGEKSKEVDSRSLSHPSKKLTRSEEKDKGSQDLSDVVVKNDAEQFQELIQEENDVSSSSHSSHIDESESDSRKLSRRVSDESHKKRHAHKSMGTGRKDGFVSANISEVDEVSMKSEEKSSARRKGREGGTVSAKNSEVDEVSMKSEEKSPVRRKVKKEGEKPNKKQRRIHSPVREIKPKPKKRDPSRDKAMNEDADYTSLSEKSEYKSEHIASSEGRYRRKVKEFEDKVRRTEQLEEDLANMRYLEGKVKELEEKVRHTEQLEEELARMRYLEGEVEHLKAVVHVLELEKSAAEALVESLQARHSEQLKRLEDVHRNELETLRQAALREEKRGADEVKRLVEDQKRMVEDHRKTLDRLMDANIKLEEEFRTRMLEARRDWGRDIEAMRVAYQQSNNTAVANASLAVLSGHSFGSEMKDKGEDDAKDDSSAAVPQCPPEIKELSEKVDRVESILAQALELLMLREKPQSEAVSVPDAESEYEKRGLVDEGSRKSRGTPVSTKGRHRRAKGTMHTVNTKDNLDQKKKASEESGSSEEEEADTEHDKHDIHNSDGVEDEEVVRSDSGYKVRRRFPKKVTAQQRKAGVCGGCRCCENRKCSRGHLCRSISTQDSGAFWDKHDKEGHYVDFRSRVGGELWRKNRNMVSWKDQMDLRNKGWSGNEDKNLFYPEISHFSLSEGSGLDTNFITHLRQNLNVIIDPKEYLVRLAAANASNLFQPPSILPTI